MILYRIANWDDHFENNRTRELKNLQWVPLPNKQDGDGYTELMDHKDGAAHFGAWVAIVQVASRCGIRGTLSRDNARPHDAASLSRMTRVPKPILEAAIKRLVEIGWIEVTSIEDCTYGMSQDGATLESQDGATLTEGNGREWKGKKGTEETPIPASLDVPRFRTALDDWKRHRREIKKPLTKTQTVKQLAKFEEWGVERSVAAIEYTVMKGWQGLQEPEVRSKPNGKLTTSLDDIDFSNLPGGLEDKR